VQAAEQLLTTETATEPARAEPARPVVAASTLFGLSPSQIRRGEAVAIPLLSLLLGAILFGLFVITLGKSPLDVYAVIYEGGFGSSFAWQNTLQRSAPYMLAALCVALPARAGLIVIGGEGALVLGGLAAALVPLVLPQLPGAAIWLALGAAALAGGVWIAMVGWLRHARGVNETIASLLLSYVAIALFNQLVETVFRDPASLNKPSTAPIGDAAMIGYLPGLEVHWGLGAAIVVCLIAYVLVSHTTWGFALKVAGGNARAARLVGLPVGRLVVAACALGGAAAGLAGGYEVLAVHGAANSSLIAGYAYTGILVSFMARHQPLGIIPVAILFGGIGAAASLLQRRLELSDAMPLVFQGIMFLCVLGCQTLYGRASR